MDKAQALHNFWNSYGLTAYDENSLPSGDKKPECPYLTYSVSTGSIGDILMLSGSLWYRSTSWQEIQKKADQIAADIGYGFKIVPIDGGYMSITKGTPFAQRMADDSDDMIRRILININVEFLTEY